MSSPPFRKNHQRQLDALQESLVQETHAKSEQARQRKTKEELVDELQGTVDAMQKVCVLGVCVLMGEWVHVCVCGGRVVMFDLCTYYW